MRTFITLALFILSSCELAMAGPPVSWNASCASGIQNLFTHACLTEGGSSSVTSFNLRTGAVVPQSSDYSSFYDTSGAASSAQAFSIQRANHTGTQPFSTITGTVPLNQGGTNNTSFTANQCVFVDPTGTSIQQDATIGSCAYNFTTHKFSINGAGSGRINSTSTGSEEAYTGFCNGSGGNCVSIQNQSGFTVQLTNAANSATAGASVGYAFSRGTLASRLQSLIGDQLGGFLAQGYTGSAFGPGYSGGIVVIATESTTSSGNGGELVLTTTANGTLTPAVSLILNQDQSASFSKAAMINGATASTNAALVVKDGHIKSTRTTAPTATVSANAGTGATCTLSNASDTAGIITLTFGSGSFATGAQCTVNFNKSYNVAPICTITANNVGAGTDAGSNHEVYFTTTTGTAVVNFGLAQNATGQVDSWMYHCIETQ